MCRFDGVSAAKQQREVDPQHQLQQNATGLSQMSDTLVDCTLDQVIAFEMSQAGAELFETIRLGDTASNKVLEEDGIATTWRSIDYVTPTLGSNHIESEPFEPDIEDESVCLDLVAFDEPECFQPAAFDDEYAEFLCQVDNNEDIEQRLFAALPIGNVALAARPSFEDCNHGEPQLWDEPDCADLVAFIEPQLLHPSTSDELECSDLVVFDEPECFDPGIFNHEYAEFMCQEGTF